MGWLPDKYQDLRAIFRRRDVDADVREELEHHVQSLIEKNLAAGMSRPAAEADARRRFGNIAQYRRETGSEERINDAVGRRGELLGAIRREGGRAARALRKNPSFSLAAIGALAIGIGATVAIFTLLDAIVLRPLPYPNADRLVRIFHPVPKVGPGERWNVAIAEFHLWRAESRTLSAVGLIGQQRLTIRAEGQGVQLQAGMATAGALAILGAKPLIGRLQTERDNERPNPATVMLSERLWRSRFGASPAVIGSMLRIEGGDAEIVGVVAGDLGFPDWAVDVWIPVQYTPGQPAQNNHNYWAVALLADGATVESATRELEHFTADYVTRFPTAYSKGFFESTGFGTIALSWRDVVIGDADRMLWILLVGAVLVLLIAAVNVGHLVLVRSQATRNDQVVRELLGASRAHLVGHRFAESGLIAGAATVGGIGLAALGLQAFTVAVPAVGPRGAFALPRLSEAVLGPARILVAGALGAIAAFGFALISVRSGEGLTGNSRSTTASRRDLRARNGLVVTQVALAVVLLAAAGFLMRSFLRLRAVDPGFDPRGVLVADLALPFNGYQTYARTTGFYRSLVREIEDIPGVERAAVGSIVPIGGTNGCAVFDYPDRPPHVNTACIETGIAGPGFFEVLGIAREGRDLAWSDLDAGTGAAALSDVLARRIFPTGALDHAIHGPGPKGSPPFKVVGVTKGVHWNGLERDPEEIVFFPLEPMPGARLWSPPARLFLVAKVSDGDPTRLTPEIRRIAQSLDPDVAVERGRTMDQVVAGSLRRVTLLLGLLGVAAAAALFLSLIGLYGVVAYTVTRRTKEIGIRIAIGAQAGAIRREIILQTLALAGLGVVIGVVGSLAMGRLLAALLFRAGGADPLTLTVVALMLATVAVLASVRPAMRAAAIEPTVALRSE